MHAELLERRVKLAVQAATPSVLLDSDPDLMVQSAAIATNLNGSSVVVYSDRDSATGKGKDVWLRRYDAAGNALAAPERVNTTTAGAQMNVDVAATGDSRYTVVWQSENQDGSGWGVYARQFDGTTWSSELLINTSTAGDQVTPRVTYGASGPVVTWADRNGNGGNGEIFARGMSLASSLSSVVQVSTSGNFSYTAPDIAYGFGASIVVTWVAGDLSNGGQADVVYRRLDGAGTVTQGSVLTANTNTAGDQAAPAITQFSSNDHVDDLVITWSDTSAGPDAAIYARRIDGQGVASFAPFEVSQDSDGTRIAPVVSAYPGGTLVFGWTQQVANAMNSVTVVRVFNNNLDAVSNEIATGDGANARTLLGIAATKQGTFREVAVLSEDIGYGIATTQGFENVITLSGTGGNDTIVAYDLNPSTVRTTVNGFSLNYDRTAYAKIVVDLGDGDDTYIGNDLTLLPIQADGGAGNDTITAGAARDTISGGDGDDWLYGGADSDYIIGNGGVDRIWGEDGDDTLTGGAGKDTIWGGNGKDRLSGSGSPDCLFGEADDDRLYGDLGDDRCDGGGGKDRLYGDEGNDLLVGNSSNDRIYAGPGDDTLKGGHGNDYLEGGPGTDTVLDKEPGDTLIDIEIS